LKHIGIFYNFKTPAARDLANALRDRLTGLQKEVWLCASNREAKGCEMAPGTEVIISIGGDGTILRASRIAVPFDVPILGVNKGRVGFMTEIDGSEALEKVPRFLDSEHRIEERAMLEADLVPNHGAAPIRGLAALNDMVLARGAAVRVARIEVRVNGSLVASYRVDGIVVATATGSTGYALACGGPIMPPESRDLILTPVSAHLSLSNPIMVPHDGSIELRLVSDLPGRVSIDGQTEYAVGKGAVLTARRSPKVVRFLRAGNSTFYATLKERLQTRATA